MREFVAKNSEVFRVATLSMFSALAFLTGVVLALPSTPISDKQAQMLEPVLQINKNCSATVVSSDPIRGSYLVTAHHCIDGKSAGEITSFSTDVLGVSVEVKIPFSVSDSDEQNDIALLHTAHSGFKVALIATQKPLEGQTVWTVGYPLGLPRMLSTGFYSQDMLLNGMNHQRASSLIAGGNSGGGLFILEDGVYKLAGVTSKGLLSQLIPQMFTPIGLYSDLKPIHDLVDVYINEGEE